MTSARISRNVLAVTCLTVIAGLTTGGTAVAEGPSPTATDTAVVETVPPPEPEETDLVEGAPSNEAPAPTTSPVPDPTLGDVDTDLPTSKPSDTLDARSCEPGYRYTPTSKGSRTTSDLNRGLHVVLLGTAGGPPPRAGQAGIASAIVVDGRVYLVDVGAAAVHQYVNAGLLLADLAAVFVTHLHVDHVADYPNLFLLGGWSTPGAGDTLAGPVPVYGPGPAGGLPASYGGSGSVTTSPADPTPGLAGLTDHACAAFAYSTNVFMRDSGIRETRALADVHEIGLAGTGATHENTAPHMKPLVVMEDDRVRVRAVLVPHGPAFPAFAYRFDTEHGSVTFSGDTTYSDNLERLADGSRLLVHEAVNVRGMSLPPVVRDHLLLSHVEVQKVGAVATRSNVGTLLLSHIGNPDGSPVDHSQWRRWARSGYNGQVHVGRDLEIYKVDRTGVRQRP